MEPDMLEGLEKTFNMYLNLPKNLWPIVELSEKRENWKDIFKWYAESVAKFKNTFTQRVKLFDPEKHMV